MAVYDVPPKAECQTAEPSGVSLSVNRCDKRHTMSFIVLIYDVLMSYISYLKSEGRLSFRLHFSHSAMFLTLPLSKRVFIFISPPHEHINLCVALAVRLFLLACPMVFLLRISMVNHFQNSVSFENGFRKPG